MAGKLFFELDELPADDNWRDVRSNLPGEQIAPDAAPRVFVSFEPAELIQLKGEPDFAPVAGTSLLWVSNTESDLFKHRATGAFLSREIRNAHSPMKRREDIRKGARQINRECRKITSDPSLNVLTKGRDGRTR